MPRTIQADGRTITVPDDATPDEINAIVGPAPASLPGVPKAPLPAGLQGPPSAPSPLGNAADAVVNFGKGIVKGGASTFLNLAQKGNDLRDWEQKNLPSAFSGAAFTPSGAPSNQDNRQYVQGLQNQTQTHGLAQSLGKGAEQVGEFMAPGLGEEAATAKLAALGPKAAAAARMLYGAATSGAVNKAQGGSFGGGALAGAAGSGLAEGLKAVAPLIAESALGVRAADRAYGRTPGQAILNETSGFNAGKIADQAKSKLGLYTNELEDAAARSPNMVDLYAPRQAAAEAEATAAARNNPEVIKRTGQLSDQLKYDQMLGGNKSAAANPPKVISGFGPPAPPAPVPSAALLPPQVTPSRALALKRGIGDLKGSWNPATSNSFVDGAVGNVYGTLDRGIDAAVPGSGALNQKMSTLMPVAARAGATDLNASSLQRILGRFTRPTGALIGGAAGAGYGYHEGGLRGAALYGTAGLVAPELIGSPTSQMIMARGANSVAAPAVVRALTGTGLQATRKKNLYSDQ